MKLYFHQGRTRNFGDHLNLWLWRQLVPDLFSAADERIIFIGIGTLINERLPKADALVIFGSGVGYGKVPVIQTNWKIYCLRGKLSAEQLGLDQSLALTDPAVLVREVYKGTERKRYRYAFMPHVKHVHLPWSQLCEELGIQYIDPRWPIERVLMNIARSRCLLAEALHGAIVADALRVPWVALQTRPDIFSFKWQDWCTSIHMPYAPLRTSPLYGLKDQAHVFDRMRHSMKRQLIKRQMKQIVRHSQPSLSRLDLLEWLTEELQRRLEQLRRDVI